MRSCMRRTSWESVGPTGRMAWCKGDWDALLAFADKFLLGEPVDRTFDQFPAGVGETGTKGTRDQGIK